MPSCEELVKVFRAFAALRRKEREERSVSTISHGQPLWRRTLSGGVRLGAVRRGEIWESQAQQTRAEAHAVTDPHTPALHEEAAQGKCTVDRKVTRE